MTNNTPLSIDTEGLAGFTVGQAKHLQLQASGGKLPYTWSTTQGTLPPGTTLNSNGLISGTPQAAGSFTVSIMVTDSAQPKASNTQAFDGEVTAAQLGARKAAQGSHK